MRRLPRKSDEDGIWETPVHGIRRFRRENHAAVRNIITGRRNREVGAFYSQLMQEHIAHDSAGEERKCRYFDVHAPIDEFFGQPETLYCDDPAAPISRYTVDFLLRVGSVEVLVESKYLSDIRPPKPRSDRDSDGITRWNAAEALKAKLRFIRAQYRRIGINWMLLTDYDLLKIGRGEVVDELVANGGWPVAEDDLGRLLHALRSAPMALGHCEELIKEGEFPRAIVTSRIQERLLQIDLHSAITADTIVRPGRRHL